VSIITVGDSAAGYQLVGVPDGMGAIAGPTGTFQLFVNHEFTGDPQAACVAHTSRLASRAAHSSAVGTSTSLTSAYNSGFDAITSTATVTNGTGGSLYNFATLLLGEIPAASGLCNATTGEGTQNRFYFTGEESGTPGPRDRDRPQHGCCVPDDRRSPRVRWFVGEHPCSPIRERSRCGHRDLRRRRKPRLPLCWRQGKTRGTRAERAGLLNGTSYGVAGASEGCQCCHRNRQNFALSGTAPARYTGTFTLAAGGTAAGTTFLRPDGAWDPAKTNRLLLRHDRPYEHHLAGVAQSSGSRLLRLRFSDVNVLRRRHDRSVDRRYGLVSEGD
jgi:hypothetical protein